MGAPSNERTYRMIASGYTGAANKVPESDGLPEGICVFDLDPSAKTAELIANNREVESPSFCQLVGGKLYAASEMPDAGGLASFDNESEPAPRLIDNVDFPNAAGTCYVLANPDGGHIYGADYNSGSVSTCKLGRNGELVGNVELIQHKGHSAPRERTDPNYDRQLSPHVHTLSIVPGTNVLAAVDLGLDLIVFYQLDENGDIVPGKTGKGEHREDGRSWKLVRPSDDPAGGEAVAELPIAPAGVVEVPLHFGPRIVAYHPTLPIVALVCELGCKLLLYKIEPGGLEWRHLSTWDLLEGASPEALARETPLSAHCEFSRDGRFLYTSTRGTDVLAVFSIDENGNASKVFACSSNGDTPRHFALSPDNRLLAVANQNGKDVSVFERNETTGKLESLMDIQVATPSCIVWE